MSILAIDTGLGSLGWATAHSGVLLECGARLFPPIPLEHVHDGYVRRVGLLVEIVRSKLRGVTHVYAESLSFARSAKATASVSLCWGALISLCRTHDVELRGIAPKRWQHALQGHKGKVDQDKLSRRIERYVSRSPIIEGQLRRLTAKERPHALDACGIAIFVTQRKVRRE